MPKSRTAGSHDAALLNLLFDVFKVAAKVPILLSLAASGCPTLFVASGFGRAPCRRYLGLPAFILVEPREKRVELLDIGL